MVRWDLITRNRQAVKTGIYIWSVESRFGTDVGKLVIITQAPWGLHRGLTPVPDLGELVLAR